MYLDGLTVSIFVELMLAISVLLLSGLRHDWVLRDNQDPWRLSPRVLNVLLLASLPSDSHLALDLLWLQLALSHRLNGLTALLDVEI